MVSTFDLHLSYEMGFIDSIVGKHYVVKWQYFVTFMALSIGKRIIGSVSMVAEWVRLKRNIAWSSLYHSRKHIASFTTQLFPKTVSIYWNENSFLCISCMCFYSATSVRCSTIRWNVNVMRICVVYTMWVFDKKKIHRKYYNTIVMNEWKFPFFAFTHPLCPL